MEFDEIVVKESPGLCRCCLSEGCYKDLGSEYSWMSETEIYAEMLLECFDISISEHPTGPNGSNRLICEVCITRLRDACNFKKQVLESEKKFVDLVAKGEFRPKVLLYQSQMKSEINLEFDEETGADDGEVEYLEEEVDFVDEELLKAEGMPSASASEDITVSALPVKGKRGRPRKTPAPALKPERKAKVPKLEDKPKTSKAVAKDVNDRRHKKTALRRHDLMLIRKNVKIVLTYGNVMPFMWTRTRSTYTCFYCRAPVKDLEALREHVTNLHEFIDLDRILSNRILSTYNSEVPVKLDVTDLACKHCAIPFKTLKELTTHIRIVHDSDYDPKVTDCFFAFELGSEKLKCCACDMTFNYFEYLLRHANKNHRKHNYSCSICAKTFHDRVSVVTHVNDYHQEGGYPCEECGEMSLTAAQRYNHKKKVHFIDHLKCPHCSVVCKSKYYKKLHLATVHGDENCRCECPECGKMFPEKGIMATHLRRVHYKERNVSCSVCGCSFFNKAHLDAHMVMHTGGEAIACDICGKSFIRKSSLLAHVKRHEVRHRAKISSY